eukprot:3935058-Rhodomonas_salina.1
MLFTELRYAATVGCYGMSGTNPAYGATRRGLRAGGWRGVCCYAVFGTDLAYAARCGYDSIAYEGTLCSYPMLLPMILPNLTLSSYYLLPYDPTKSYPPTHSLWNVR